MALVAKLKSEQPLRLEIQLGQALCDFQDTLTSEQRASFQANRIHSTATPPTIRDVMNTTAEVDREARRDKKGNHQSFGPRFTRFLEVVQQYASIGDVLIGGSQNLIACGVWSLVRVTLLTVCKFSSYLERVSRLFMDIGQSVPQIQDIANLYPDSKALQRLVAEYFLGVVNLCQGLMSLYKQSIAEQLKSFFSDWNATRQESELANSSRSIYEQLQIENAQLSSSSLSRLNILSSQRRNRQAQKDYHRLLDACSTYKYMSAWKRTRKIGYSTWGFCKTEYDAWTSNPESSTLILKGKLGGGKSVLLANMIDDLNLRQVGFKVVYFFCQEDDAVSLDSRTIVGCLSRQLLQLLRPGELVDCTSNLTNPESDDLFDLIKNVLPAKEKVFVVLDGIESCELKEENELLAWIRDLQDHLALAVCISCRIDASSMIGRDIGGMKESTWITLPDDRPEISDYIKDQLAKKIKSGEVRFRDPSIQSSIEESLVSRCQGMFLWVRLQLESICQEQTDEAMLSAVSLLPATLPDLFHDILSRHYERSPKYQTALLKVLSTVLRPLLVSELEEALSVVPEVTSPQPGQLVNNIRAVLASCGSLVVVDEEQDTVHFVHHSVDQYLSDASSMIPGNQNIRQYFTPEDAQRWMGDIVVTYLSWDRFNVAVVGTQETIEHPINRIPGIVLESTMLTAIPAAVRTRAARLSSRYITQAQPSGATVASLKVHAESSTAPGFWFQQYAGEYWLHHTRRIHESSPRIWSLFTDLASKRSLVIGALLWKDRPPEDLDDQNSWARYHSHTAMLVHTFDNNKMIIVRTLHKAIEVLSRAQTKLKDLMRSSSGIAEQDPSAESQRVYDLIADICDMHREQLRLLKAAPSLTQLASIFEGFVEIFKRYQTARKLVSKHSSLAFNSIISHVNDFKPALQTLYKAAEAKHVKRRILLAMHAAQRVVDYQAESDLEPFIDDEVKALILNVDDWADFPITRVGPVKERASFLRCHSYLDRGVHMRTSVSTTSGFLYKFSEHLIFIRGISPGVSLPDFKEPLDPYWYCRLDQVSSILIRSNVKVGTYKMRTSNGKSITFELKDENHEAWLRMVFPSISFDSIVE